MIPREIETASQRRLRIARRDVLRAGASDLGALALGDAFARDGAAGRTRPSSGCSGAAPRTQRETCRLALHGRRPESARTLRAQADAPEARRSTPAASLAAGRRFAFIDPARSRLLATRRKFQRHGESGAPVSELLPHIGGIVDKLCFLRGVQGKEINHGPAKLFMNTGHGLLAGRAAARGVFTGLVRRPTIFRASSCSSPTRVVRGRRAASGVTGSFRPRAAVRRSGPAAIPSLTWGRRRGSRTRLSPTPSNSSRAST